MTFTLTAIDDFLDERVEAVSITGTIEDAGFEVIGTTVSITDNDERGVRISPISLRVPEGGEETYTVVLTARPSGEVTVTPSLASDDTDVTAGAALTFTAADWDQARTVTVSAAQDADAANDTATIVHAVSGADYGTNEVTAGDVSVTVDDDEAALTLTVNPTVAGRAPPWRRCDRDGQARWRDKGCAHNHRREGGCRRRRGDGGHRLRRGE